MSDNDQPTLDFSQPESGDHLGLAGYAQRAYLEYALSVVKGRALPDVCDGMKPVQRRILFAMERMGLAYGGPTRNVPAKPVKSARVVGDVLGRFHPHGDQSAYDALVRLAQDFSQRYPLIDGQGNFGSRDGDGAAAMRYTEARLTRIASLLLDEIDQGTVDFVPNYDGSTEEPRQLPARLPFALLNGASGIAVGLATEIPSHNLREIADACVALVKNPKLADEELAALVPGPDYPGGGQIISSPGDIQDAYRTGARQPQGARALENRGPGARPVADGGDRTAARRLRAEGAGRDRGAHQSQGEGRQEGALAGADAAQGHGAGRAGRGARRVEQGRARAHRVRAQDGQGAAAGADHHAAGAHQPGDLRAHQPDHGGPGRQARAEVAAAHAGGVDRLPPADHHAAQPASPRQGAGPHPHPRGAADRAAQHRRGDRHHPRERRAQGRADRALPPVGPAGRGHPGNPPAPARAARSHQDRAGTQGTARGTGQARGHPRQPCLAAPPHGQGDRGGREAVRRRAPHPHPGRQARHGRGEGGR